jgi:hypothetical protein
MDGLACVASHPQFAGVSESRCLSLSKPCAAVLGRSPWIPVARYLIRDWSMALELRFDGRDIGADS